MLNFSLKAKKRIPSHVSLVRQRQILQLSQQKHNNVKESAHDQVIIVNVEEAVKDVITYEIGEQIGEPSNVIIDPQPCVEEPVIETLSSSVVNVNEEVLEPILETSEEVKDDVVVLETPETTEGAETTEVVETSEAVNETDNKKKKKGKNGRK